MRTPVCPTSWIWSRTSAKALGKSRQVRPQPQAFRESPPTTMTSPDALLLRRLSRPSTCSRAGCVHRRTQVEEEWTCLSRIASMPQPSPVEGGPLSLCRYSNDFHETPAFAHLLDSAGRSVRTQLDAADTRQSCRAGFHPRTGESALSAYLHTHSVAARTSRTASANTPEGCAQEMPRAAHARHGFRLGYPETTTTSRGHRTSPWLWVRGIALCRKEAELTRPAGQVQHRGCNGLCRRRQIGQA